MNLLSTFLELDKLYESKASLTEWRLIPEVQPQPQQSQPSTSNQPIQNTTKPVISSQNGKPVVVIVSDHGRLRALGTDGANPAAFVAFPNDLRQFEGQKYEVDQLIWNGKNYRVAGNIVEI